MNTTKLLLLITISIVLLSACGGGGGGGSSNNDDPYGDPPPEPMDSFPSQVATPASMVVNDNGSLILAASGLSLYTFDTDTADTSNCAGTPGDFDTCAGRWPPLLAGSGAQANEVFTIIARADGDNQWALSGQPLYHYYLDVSQGDVMGDGVGGLWHLARRQPLAVTTIKQLPTYVGFETILTVADSSGVLTSMRVNKNDLTLYTFDIDPLNASACSGDCINVWPPLLADAGAKAVAPLNIVDVADGNRQWSYKGKPLYFFANDMNAGDGNGDEVNDVWHTATLEPAIQRTTANGRSLSATGTDKDGFSLYIFDNDSYEMSDCQDGCLVNWPAFVPGAGEQEIGNFTRFIRADDTEQWAYNGMPLYFFKDDLLRGDINGDVFAPWHIVHSVPVKVDDHASEGLLFVGHGNVLDSQGKTGADLTGLTLYTFDLDVAGSGESVCTTVNNCVGLWPPLYASSADQGFGEYSIISRNENNATTLQWSYKGLPLYFYVGDSAVGDTTGDYLGWTIARP